MHSSEDTGQAAWRLEMLQGCRFLAIGSLFLLAGSILWIWANRSGFPSVWGAFGPATLRVLGVLAILMYGLGWGILALAVSALRRQAAKSTITSAIVRTFQLSFIAFGVGLATLPLAFPGGVWTQLLLGGFPYVPSVYGPMILFHGAMFILSARLLRGSPGSGLVFVGGVVLSGFGALGLTIHVFLTVNVWESLALGVLGGLGGAGYALAAVGWLRGVRMLPPVPTAPAK